MDMKLLNKELIGRLITVFLFIVLSIAGIGFSVYLFSIANTLNMYILSASFLFLSLIAGFFNLYASLLYFRSYFYDSYLEKINRGLKPLTELPTVAVCIPMYNEDPQMVERNVAELTELNYPKEKLRFYLADDSNKPEIVEGVRDVAKRHGCTLVHRDERNGFKAGALNNAIRQSGEEFVAIFDSDELLSDRNFLLDLLPYFGDQKISYIQTEKRYAKQNSIFSDSIDIFDAFFFKFIQPARALNNTAIFAGSCGVVRRSAFDEIGGFPEYVIEDTFFSFESDLHNYKSLYVPKIYAYGRPIRSFTELMKQQWRYNYGDTQFISYYLKKRNASKRSPLSNMDYIGHGFGLNYLSVILVMFTLVSIGVAFSAVPFAHISDINQLISPSQMSLYVELLGFFAFTLSLLTPVILTKIYFGSLKKGFMVFLLNYALAFVRTRAAIATFMTVNPGIHWNRSKSNEKEDILYSLSNTRTEIVFGAVLFGLGFISLAHSNISGGLWLTWYGILYSLATILLYKYG